LTTLDTGGEDKVPIYEYECSSCGERSQRLERVGEDSSGRRCLTCGEGDLRKVVSMFGTTSGSGGTAACDITERRRSG